MIESDCANPQDRGLRENQACHTLLEGQKVPRQYTELAGVGHSNETMYEKLGDRTAEFYSKAFGKTPLKRE